MSYHFLQISIMNKVEFDRFYKQNTTLVGQNTIFDCLQNYLILNP